jgi:hypothetical protein
VGIKIVIRTYHSKRNCSKVHNLEVLERKEETLSDNHFQTWDAALMVYHSLHQAV